MKKARVYYRLFVRFLRHYFRARTRYDIHSPFVYQLIEEVVEDNRQYYAFPEIEHLRWRLRKNKRKISITDYGAGSKVIASSSRSIASIARYSAVSASTGQQLFRLANLFHPKKMLELGTSLGISTAYQKTAVLNAEMISIEGCPETAQLAQQHLQAFEFSNLDIRTGSFSQLLPTALQDLSKLDYLYLDGDHRRGASLEYFQTCLEYAHENSIFIIADIHWSAEMEDAWRQMKNHPNVTLSIDLFHLGLLFFRKEQKTKEHYSLIKAKYKPWRMGVRM